MRNFSFSVLGLLLLNLLAISASAQAKLEVRINRLYSSADNEWGDGDIEHTWKFLFKDNVMAGFAMERCHARNTGHDDTGYWWDIGDVYTAKTYFSANPTSFEFMLRGYEDDVGHRCDEDGRDEQKESAIYPVDLKDFSPGVWSKVYPLETGSRKYRVEFQLRYTPIAPTIKSITTATSPPEPAPIGQICANDATTTLTSKIDLETTTGLQYDWEYNIKGDESPDPYLPGCQSSCYREFEECELMGWGNCYANYDRCHTRCMDSYPPVPKWNKLNPASTGPSYVFIPEALIAFPGGLTENRGVKFRVKAVGKETSSAFGTPSIFYSFSPSAPKNFSVSVPDMACYGKPDAKINVTGVQGMGSYLYTIKSGISNDTTNCNPTIPGSNCLDNVLDSKGASDAVGHTFSSNPKIPEGTHTIFISNPGGTKGTCFTAKTFKVGTYANLTIPDQNTMELTCHNVKNGTFSETASGGKPGFNYTLTGPSYSFSRTGHAAGVGAYFDNIGAGDYTLTVTDGCNQTVNKSFKVTQPALVSGSRSPQAATCNTPGNGAARTDITLSSGSYDVSKSSLYEYVLYKDNVEYSRSSHSEATLTWNDLPPDDGYKIVVKQQGVGDCNAYIEPFTINGPAPLNITSLDVNSVKCFNGEDGLITLEGTGGTGSYSFELSGTETVSNTTGNFSDLKSGEYTITVKNQIACEDRYTHPVIKVEQPLELIASISKTDITCYDKNDGQVTSIVTGGINETSGYEYAWQELIGETWASLSTTTETLINRQEGSFRLIVKDDNQCKATSAVVTIIRPTEISINSVDVSDIKCLGEKGTIKVNASGGISPFTFEYAPVPGSVFTNFTETTPLSAGVYKVQVKDRNGCPQNDGANTYTITSPPTALDFAFEKSTYNGYNISCFDGINGSITLTPSGGNGSSYSGYSYRADTRSFSSENLIAAINAGNHQIAVKDGRGCVVVKNINFTQAPELQTLTTFKQDVNCYGESTGVLELEVTGGVGPFDYQVAGKTPQSLPRFTELGAGDYSFEIIDKNSCKTAYADRIVNHYPAITSTTAINDVSCYQGSDGSISLNVSGGASSTYAYELDNTTPTANPVNKLKAGTYKVTVQDSKGCKHDVNNLIVGEPAELLIDKVDYNDIVCLGDKGTIQMQSSGGTSPFEYQYSIDNGITYKPFTSATQLDANTYTLRVRDNHDCFTQYNENIPITNPSGPLNFSYELSNYNGFNISCYGGNNGFITVNSQGGNGAGYTEYQFAVDTSPYQSEPKLTRINAGPHIVYLRDERGCVVSKNISFSQSLEQLNGLLASKENVKCFYEQVGKLEVLADGGVGPYKYWITDTNKQDSPAFGSLAVGDYIVTIQDKNECETTVPASIQSIHPEFYIAFDARDVNCFNGQDGSIDLSVSGGVSPFQYQWKNQPSTTNILQNVKTGTYEVTVTDGANCVVTKSVSIGQPAEPLKIRSIETHTACYNQDNGAVTIEASGGTQPYQYSIDNEKTFHNDASISSSVGDLSVIVKDKNGCVIKGTTTVEQRNNRPFPNFYVSARQNALDTLILTDVSVPKPDSIHWAFDANTEIVKANQWSPEIKFSEEGTYPVTMTSFFGDCAYTVTKNILLRPFDPDRVNDKLPGVNPIQSIDVSPNPSTGEFTVAVKLNKKRDLSIIVYSTIGNIVYQNNYEEISSIDQYINITSSSAGLYLIRVITESDAKDVRIIVNK